MRRKQTFDSNTYKLALNFINRFQKDNGFPPTIAEVAAGMEISVGHAQKLLGELMDEKLITRVPNQHRSMRVVSNE